MARKALWSFALAMVLFAGGCTSDDKLSNIGGSWNMVANTAFSFTLVINQDGGTITGSMVPIVPGGATQTIGGTIDANDKVTFGRSNSVGVYQTYSGSVSGGGSTMSGTFTQVGTAGTFPWAATKI